MKQLLSGAVVLLLLAACESERSRASTDSFFTDISLNVGLDFVHEAGEDSSFHMPEIGGAGVAFLDFDNDGDLDIYLVNGGFHADPSRRVANRLYRQDDGRLIDVTAESGLGDTGYGMGVAVGDIDNDGFVDVYVSNHGLDALYRNLGNGSFADITTHAGIANPHWSSSVVMFDFNRDGLLDIYVTNYLRLDASVTCPDLAGRPDYCGPASFDGLPDVLYENLGDARFADVSVASGIAAPASKGLGVVSADFNGDLYPDLYVANDGEANHVWLNSGAGTFSDAAPRLGAAVNGLGLPEAGMGVALGDLED
ncbi:MAG: FG-GAP repeat domain-containing protein, partial [Gemmatimonadales bacterium]